MARKFILAVLVPLLGAAFVATDFGASLTGPSVSFAQEKKRQGLFQRLFRPRDRSPSLPNRAGPSSSSRKAVRPSVKRIARPSGYRTLCVRTCDGYYFPISHSISRSRLKTDEAVCKSMYGGAGAELFFVAGGRSAERAVSLSRQRLAAQPYAFAYRSTFDESCQRELKSGLAHLEGVFIGRTAEATAKETAPAGLPQDTIPVPVGRTHPGQDPETLANLAGRFSVVAVRPMDQEQIAVASAPMRRLGSDYYYRAPLTIDTLYEPPDLGPRFTLIGAAHAAEREADDGIGRP